MSQPNKTSKAESIALLPKPKRSQFFQSLTESEASALRHDWGFWGRPEQLLPGSQGAAISRSDWVYWLLLAGRGFGKTRTGAETVRQWAANPGERILMIAPTANDVREIMLEGPSGLLTCYSGYPKPIYNPSRRLVSFPSGAIGITRSADEPERLRGPQFTKFWADELGAWRFVQDAWDQIQFGFRLKTSNLQGIITTTPKPLKLIRELAADQSTVLTRGSSYDNRRNLSEQFYLKVLKPYEGTRLGRQEIEGELLEDVQGALWNLRLIDQTRVDMDKVPELVRVVVAVDPATTANEGSDETGIVVAGIAANGHCYVLADYSVKCSPGDWALVVLQAYLTHHADRIVGEVNNGGDLVEGNLRGAVAARGLNPAGLPFRAVRASRGKAIRAEPAAALYERGIVHHTQPMGKLEDQMVGWVPGMGLKSPDRMDALVWALFDLVIDSETHYIVTTAPMRPISPI
jgi:phage terminase large subunit-like protein